MARSRSGSPHIVARVIVLILLIIILAGGGLLWFDFLEIIDAKQFLGPVYGLLGLEKRRQEPTSQTLSIDDERLGVRLEAVELRSQELDQREAALKKSQSEIEQMNQEVQERRKALEEQEKSFNAMQEDDDVRRKNIEQNARYLTGMQPAAAVAILAAMNDQDAIDVLRMTEEIARQEESSSMVAYWLSLLPPERAAELQRKMAGRPPAFN